MPLKARLRAFRVRLSSNVVRAGAVQLRKLASFINGDSISGSSIRAVRVLAGTRHWQVRHGRRWVSAVLCEQYRGPFWVTLRLRSDPMFLAPSIQYRVTVWRPRVSASVWRRFCVVLGAVQRLDVPVVRRSS